MLVEVAGLVMKVPVAVSGAVAVMVVVVPAAQAVQNQSVAMDQPDQQILVAVAAGLVQIGQAQQVVPVS
jgi:hypothetical protein